MFEGCSDLRASGVVMFKNRHVDQLEVLGVANSVLPDSFLELDPVIPCRGEARVRNIFELTITVCHMVCGTDKCAPDRIKEIARNPLIVENAVDQICKAMALVIRICVDFGIRVACRGVTVEASSALAVFEDHHLSIEPIRMAQDPLDKPSDEIAIRTAAIFPLSIDLDQDDIVGFDHSGRTTQASRLRGSIKFEPLTSHQAKEIINPRMEVPTCGPVVRIVRNILDPKDRI
jgi:hypothetical protein